MIELDTVSGPMRVGVGFGSNIGGQIEAARLLLRLAEVTGVTVRIEAPGAGA